MLKKISLFILLSTVASCSGTDSPTAPIAPPPPAPPSQPQTLSASILAALDTLVVNDTISLTATVQNALGQITSASLAWTTSDSSIFTLSGTRLIARRAGQATLTLTASQGSLTATATKPVSISADSIISLVLTAPDSLAVASGFLPTAVASGRRGRALPSTITFTSSNPGILELGNDNFALARTVGAATLTAQAAGISASKNIQVRPVPVPIRLVFLTPPTLAQKQVAYEATSRWSRLFTAPLTGAVVSIAANSCDPGSPSGTFAPQDGITLMVSFKPLDLGVGQGGECVVRLGTETHKATTVVGIVRIDSDYFTARPDERRKVMTHEIGHALGIGAYRVITSSLVTGYPNNQDPRYLGAEGFRQYKLSGGTATVGVPLGQPGTSAAWAHWRADQVFGEVMTQGGDKLSGISVGYLIDMGYAMDPARADAYTVTFPVGAIPLNNSRLPVTEEAIHSDIITARQGVTPSGRLIELR